MPRINDLPAPEGPERTQRAEERERSEAAKSRTGGTTAADSIEISSGARETQELQGRLVDAARDVPDVRQDRVAEARARLESGELDSENARRVIADRLLDQMGI